MPLPVIKAPAPSRRQFLTAVGNLASASWLTLNWPQIAQAAVQAEHGAHGGGEGHASLTTLTASEAAEVDAIANQIVPGGDTPGARQAKSVLFIDNALGSFFGGQLPAFREGLAQFTAAYAASAGAGSLFSAASDEQQIAFLQEVDETPFFTAVRRLTVLGLIALPKYGGNHEYAGWNLIKMENSHVFSSPFGFYDRDYPGFEPYPGHQPYTA